MSPSRSELLAGGESEAGLKGVRAVWRMFGSWYCTESKIDGAVILHMSTNSAVEVGSNVAFFAVQYLL